VPAPKPAITLRRPSGPPLAAADRFVAGDRPSSEPAAGPPPQSERPSQDVTSSTDIASQSPRAIRAEPDQDLDVQTAGGSDVQPLRPGIVQRRSGRIRRRTTVYLEPSLATKLAIYCATYSLELSKVAEDALERHLSFLQRGSARPVVVADGGAGQGALAAD
jgi:hypothetical protein